MSLTPKRAGHGAGSQNGFTFEAMDVYSTSEVDAAIASGAYVHPNHSGHVTSSGDGATTLAVLNLRGAGKYTVDDQVANATGAVYADMDTVNAFTATGSGSTMGPAWLRFKSATTVRGWVDWSAGSALRFYAVGRMDFESASNLYFSGSTLQIQAHSSFNRVGDAGSTATQKDSYGVYLQNSLWTGSASTQRHALIRSKASTATNYAHRLAFFLNTTGGLGTEGTEVFALDFDGTSTYEGHFKGKFGYPTGQGGTVTQATNKSTAVTLSKLTGEITMNGAALAAGAIVSFTLTNTFIAATDVLVLNHSATGTVGAYLLNCQCGAGSAVINVRNTTAGSLSEAIKIRFAVIKGATA